jgi:hypothetical protein
MKHRTVISVQPIECQCLTLACSKWGFIFFHTSFLFIIFTFGLTTCALKTPPASSQKPLGTSILKKTNFMILTVDSLTALGKVRHFSFHSKTEIYFFNRIYALPFELYFFSSLYFWVFYGISTIISPSAIPSPSAYNRANLFFKIMGVFSRFFLVLYNDIRIVTKKITFLGDFFLLNLAFLCTQYFQKLGTL